MLNIVINEVLLLTYLDIGAKKKSSLKVRLIYNPMNINTSCEGHCSGF
jgi:hypothetical protein